MTVDWATGKAAFFSFAELADHAWYEHVRQNNGWFLCVRMLMLVVLHSVCPTGVPRENGSGHATFQKKSRGSRGLTNLRKNTNDDTTTFRVITATDSMRTHACFLAIALTMACVHGGRLTNLVRLGRMREKSLSDAPILCEQTSRYDGDPRRRIVPPQTKPLHTEHRLPACLPRRADLDARRKAKRHCYSSCIHQQMLQDLDPHRNVESRLQKKGSRLVYIRTTAPVRTRRAGQTTTTHPTRREHKRHALRPPQANHIAPLTKQVEKTVYAATIPQNPPMASTYV